MSEDVSISSKRSDKAPSFPDFLFILLKSGPDVVTRGRGLGLLATALMHHVRYGYMYVRYGCMDVLYVCIYKAGD